jgi:hypothetical protein
MKGIRAYFISLLIAAIIIATIYGLTCPAPAAYAPPPIVNSESSSEPVRMILSAASASVAALLADGPPPGPDISAEVPEPPQPAVEPVTATDWYGVPWDKLEPRLQALYIPTEKEIVRLSQCMFGEDRGPSITRRAAVAWCVLNRIDAGGDFEKMTTVAKVVYHGAFEGYSPYNPVWPSLQNLAIDVVTRWINEKLGVEEVGRVLGPEFTFFMSDGRLHNNFRTTFSSKDENCVFCLWYELDYSIYES